MSKGYTINTEEKDKRQSAVLVGLNCQLLGEDDASYETLDELEELLTTAGGICVGKILQSRPSPDTRTLIGAGKLMEIAEIAKTNDSDMLIFDNELSPSQFKAIEADTGLTVLDRSGLILDIFASRARSAEGKLQVELAQYKYLLPRLSGLGNQLSRLGGGIGTRGPGETKLESDRRHIRRRISRLEAELADLRKVRTRQRNRRKSLEIPLVSIVGYTNTGKSTLLNTLTGSAIEANDRLFDTLDTTIRKLKVSDTLEVLLSDTVGFIHKLPHNLIEAFKATLEELEYADLLLHVIDISNPAWKDQAEVTEKLIFELAGEDVKVINLFNKCDKTYIETKPSGRDTVLISAKTGEGIEDLLKAIEELLDNGTRKAKFLFPYSESGRLDILYRDAKVLCVDYKDEGINVSAVCDKRTLGWAKEYLYIETSDEEE